jgi:hypothetical protein
MIYRTPNRRRRFPVHAQGLLDGIVYIERRYGDHWQEDTGRGATDGRFIRRLIDGERDGLVFVDEAPAMLLRQLRRQPGKDICLMGGGELAREFLTADLVDELCLRIAPVLLGEGIRLFPAGFPQRNFELVESKTYSKGLIALKYKRAQSRKNQSTKKRK